MKIIGYIYYQGGSEMILKGDSCLLNGGKPLFIPDWTTALGVTPCSIIRVSRMGKEIAPRFAHRYYDAIAPGMDFVAMDILAQAQHDQRSWTKALAFDYSLALGQWIAKEEWEKAQKDEQFSAEPIIRPGYCRSEQMDDHSPGRFDIYPASTAPQSGTDGRSDYCHY